MSTKEWFEDDPMIANKHRLQIAIIIPAYNETATIAQVIYEFHLQLPDAQIWVVDNNSSDDTGAKATDTIENNQILGGVLVEKRQGKSNAMRLAFRKVEADIYVMVDADLTYSAADLYALLTPIIEHGIDITIGERFSRGEYSMATRRRFHSFGNNIVRSMVNRIFKSELSDIMSGYRAMSREFVKLYPLLCEGFELETEMTIHAVDKRFRLLEVPVAYRARPEGSQSKLSTFRDGIRVIRLIGMLYKNYRPLSFFNKISLITMFLSCISGSVPVIEFFKTGKVLHLPLSILASGLGILAVLLFGIGLTMDIIIELHRHDFELRRLSFHSRKDQRGLC